MEGTHDDEPTRWTSIGWQALLIMNRLRCEAQLTKKHQKEEDQERPADSNNGDRTEKHPDEQRKYVEHRLRELRAWERKLSGKR